MKIILKETGVDYKTYHFGYAINAILENEESLEKAYSKGFLPYTCLLYTSPSPRD